MPRQSSAKRQYVQVQNGPAQRLARQIGESASMPEYVEPLLATEGSPPKGDRWVHEIKYDGYRFQLYFRNGMPRFLTRRGNDWTDKVQTVVAATVHINSHNSIIDGEMVIPTANGGTDFGELKRELSLGNSAQLAFYAFDILYLDGYDLRRCALLDRKEVLRLLLEKVDYPIVYSDHADDPDGPGLFREACKTELEGIVSKRKDAPYASGRSSYWIKKPCRKRDTFIVAGWAEKRGKFDGIYLAKREGRELVYAGKLERGFSDEDEREILAILKPLTVSKQPMSGSRDRFPKAKWVKPEVMVEAEFRGKTSKGLLRHPSYKGIREDLQ
jgi:bifunctional non-homologous end joining protein LigD